jgi:processive 1,2-diacylglycerol beta-glucosyltransferase
MTSIPSPFEPRIIILSASVGAGHVRAAQAIQTALARQIPGAAIEHLDVLELTNAPFRRAYGKGYFRAAQRAPRFVGWMYDFLDHPNDHGAAALTRQFFERLNFKRLSRLLTDRPWDLAICTHFLPAALIARLRRRELINYPQAVVVTDFDVHGMWVSRPTERFFVASDEAKVNLASQDVDHRDIRVTGIPIEPAFAEPVDRKEAARKLNLAIDRPIILQLAGGFGIGSIERIHRGICQIDQPLQIVVVTGRNTKAAETLSAVECPSRHPRTILGFTDQMRLLLAAADLVVTKPGGLTSAESIASSCPMVIVEPIPGQEDRNADFLLENGCAIKVNNLASLHHKLSTLLDDPHRLLRMRAAASNASRPNAAADVARHCAQLLKHPPVLV